MWFLRWPSFALTHGQNPLFTNYIDYPAGVNLMWNTTALLPALALAPIGHLAGFVLAYNVLMTAGVALSAWTAFLLIRRFVSSSLAAGVGGLLYGFSPFMTAHSLGHSQLTVAFMPPVLLIVLDEIVRVQRRRPLVSGLLLGVAAAAQLLIGEELLAMTAVVGLLLLCLAARLYPGAVLVAILSMGVTIHVAGKVSSMPVFVLGLIFPLLQRYLPGRLMLYLTFGGWLALSRLPILNNILPSRLMIFFYLLAGLLIAAWLSDMKTSPAGERRFGLFAVVAALFSLIPALPFPSTPNTVPRFFASSSVQRIPAGSVALVIPYSSAAEVRAMPLQGQAGMNVSMAKRDADHPRAILS